MKKIIASILAVICFFMLVGCSNETNDEKVKVFTFYGENDYISVTNGTAVLCGEEEVFSGGTLEVLNEEAFADAVYWSSEFYIAKDGEEKIVTKSIVEDLSEPASVSISGDLGKMSGPDIITVYGYEDTEDFVNNLFMRFTVRNAQGEESTYELHMQVEQVY